MVSKKMPSRRATTGGTTPNLRDNSNNENANSAADEYEYEEKIRRKLARENRSASMPTSSTSAAESAFEERLKCKLDGGKGNHPKNLSSSMVDSKAYEEKIRRKVESSSDDRNLTSSMPANSMSISRDILNDEQMGQKRENDYSMEQGYSLEDDVGKTDHVAIEQESYLEVSNVCFDDLFSDLHRFKEENGNLSIPVSHPSFMHIMDNFSSSGMEELLKKRWDYQLAGLKAFKREHGDCLIPVSHPTLGQWTRIQSDHYKRYEQRLPSPLTKKRFDKLSKIGFDKYVSWEETDKNGGNLLRKEQRKSAETVEHDDKSASGDESEAIISDNLTLDQKIQMKKMGNKVKFTERGLKAHSSSKERRPDKEAVTAELYEKRMSRRSVRRGFDRSHSKKVITETIEENIESDFTDVCNVPNNERRNSLNTSIRLADIAPTSASTSTDDINIESWSELCDVLAGVATQSGAEASLI